MTATAAVGAFAAALAVAWLVQRHVRRWADAARAELGRKAADAEHAMIEAARARDAAWEYRAQAAEQLDQARHLREAAAKVRIEADARLDEARRALAEVAEFAAVLRGINVCDVPDRHPSERPPDVPPC